MEHKSTILIVDDEPVGRDTLEALLFDQGYELAFASNGPEALAVAAELAPDLILLDVMMPGMDGFEVCQRLRADSLLGEVPIVMVTALDDRDSRLRGIEAGADDFVNKPFNRAELRARVRTVARLNRYRRLLTERTRFEWVVERATDGYVVVSDSDEILYANPRARLYLGLSAPGHVEGEPGKDGSPSRMLHPRGFLELARQQYRCEPQEVWKDWPRRPAMGFRGQRYLVRPESSTAQSFWLQVDTLDMPSGPDPGWFVHLRDVTAEIAQQRDMHGFHEVVSHKMRTPLMGILGSLELLAGLGDQLSPDEIVTFAKSALAGTRRLRGTVESILEYLDATGFARATGATKLGAGFRLGQLCQVAAETSSNLGLESVTVSCPEELADVCVRFPQRSVELALWEVLENSKKFHPEGAPTVEIEVSRPTARGRHTLTAGALSNGNVSPMLARGDQEICLRIQDDGMVISPEHLEQIWMPYYQGEKYFTGEAKGMGLGLAMVAALVWEVGGTCRAHNREDRPGVVVELILPTEENNGGTTV